MDRDAVVTLMQSSKTGAEWNANQDAVKAAYDGGYPSFWFDAIIETGLLRKTGCALHDPTS